MRHRTLVIAWLAFALPVLILAAGLWRGTGDAAAQKSFAELVQLIGDKFVKGVQG